jgi:vacuolar-type H+-ATPase subunit C/Vma6
MFNPLQLAIGWINIVSQWSTTDAPTIHHNNKRERLMTIEHIRRGIEFDAIKAMKNLKKHDGNRSTYDIGDCVEEHIEKFAYICSDEPVEEIFAHVTTLARAVSEAAQGLTQGEKYYVHDEHIDSEIKKRVQRFKKELSERPAGPKF